MSYYLKLLLCLSKMDPGVLQDPCNYKSSEIVSRKSLESACTVWRTKAGRTVISRACITDVVATIAIAP